MKYLNLDLEAEENRIIIHRPDSFIPSHIFENGQCFRWRKEGEEHYTGIAGNRIIEVKKENDDVMLINTGFEDFRDIWYEYFDLGRDYGSIKQMISKDRFSSEAASYGKGLRILKQDYFETIFSFIVSQNNNIPRITKIIENICRSFGKEIIYRGKTYFAFPEQEDFTDIETDELGPCRAGYRCGYLSALSKTGIPVKEELEKMELQEQRELLFKMSGIGPKVADCILLFSGINTKAFPIDVWVKKVMKDIYGVEGNNKKLYDFAYGYFNGEPGLAQQYLFYYARSLKLG